MKEIALTKGMVALVDDEDFERLSQLKWHAHRGKRAWYALHTRALGNRKWETIIMHRFILGLKSGDPDVDHRDLNGLNNQKENLRIATNGQNASNTMVRSDSKSGLKGVRLVVRGGSRRWRAQIKTNGRIIWLGAFDTAEEAAAAYAVAAQKYHGEFARTSDVVS